MNQECEGATEVEADEEGQTADAGDGDGVEAAGAGLINYSRKACNTTA